MTVGFMLLGFIVGAYLSFGSGAFSLGALGGAAIGALFARLVQAERRLRELEAALRHPGRSASPPAGTQAPGATPQPGPQAQPSPVAAPTPEAAPARPAPSVAAGLPPDRRVKPAPKQPSRPSLLRQLLAMAGRWLTTGNVPVKVGVLLSFIGVAFLLKYAIDHELLVVPIEFRLLGVSLAAVALLVLGWRLRRSRPGYALSLQGGGAGILFLTIFAAFRIWALLPAALAFGLLVTLAALTAALAVLQKSRWLIMLAVTGAFLAPVLASTGRGDHVALFSYYLVINAAILAVSWFNAWRGLNLLGWVFTFVIGLLWGYHYYRPALFASTEPFLVLHFLLYQAVAILFALRQPADRPGLVDGTLVFGTPVIAFAMQAGLLRGSEYGLAISAAVVAVFYAMVATWLQRREGKRQRLLVESFAALAVAFATLAIPLALDAYWTAAAWALEGAALAWVGARQSRHLATLAGAGLVVFAGFSFALGGWRPGPTIPVVNSNVLGGVLIAISAVFSARTLQVQAGRFASRWLVIAYRPLSWMLLLWGLAWWFGTGFMEIDIRFNDRRELPVGLLFITASVVAFAALGRRLHWNMPELTTLAFLPVLIIVASGSFDAYGHFLLGLGWLAWPLAGLAQVWLLRRLDEIETEPEAPVAGQLAVAWHLGSGLLLTVLAAQEAAWHTARQFGGDWNAAVASMVPGLLALLIWRMRRRPAWPVPRHPGAYRVLALLLVAGQLAYLLRATIALPGDPGPLLYVPLLNPFDLATLFALVCAWLSLKLLQHEEHATAALPAFRVALLVAVFVLTTLALVRGVHHFAGVPWRFSALNDSVIVHTALSIYWGLLGFTGMVLGARRMARPLWLVGAGFMALVVLKLFLVDLGNTGTIERIISFIGIGVLLLAVGYFAPAPPRATTEETA